MIVHLRAANFQFSRQRAKSYGGFNNPSDYMDPFFLRVSPCGHDVSPTGRGYHSHVGQLFLYLIDMRVPQFFLFCRHVDPTVTDFTFFIHR
jgi:hypothetical protein